MHEELRPSDLKLELLQTVEIRYLKKTFKQTDSIVICNFSRNFIDKLCSFFIHS